MLGMHARYNMLQGCYSSSTDVESFCWSATETGYMEFYFLEYLYVTNVTIEYEVR